MLDVVSHDSTNYDTGELFFTNIFYTINKLFDKFYEFFLYENQFRSLMALIFDTS